MAEPIRNIKPMEVSQEELQSKDISEVLTVVSENKDSIIKGIEFLSTLDSTGGLDTVNALLIHRKVAMEKLINEINKDRYSSSLENLMPLFTLIGSLKVDEVSYFVDRINNGMKDAIENDTYETTSYMGLLKALKDPEINRSITMVLEFLKGMGRE